MPPLTTPLKTEILTFIFSTNRMELPWAFLVLLPVVAFLYASVGHGGASGYLALMALFSFSVNLMRPTALVLNIFVSAISFYHFWKAGHFNGKLFLLFAVSSIPLSFLGGLLTVNAKTYKIILGVFLLIAILRLLGLLGKTSVGPNKRVHWPEGLLTGGIIGFFSGLIGIGGGIILSPVIVLFKWGSLKEAAAVSALFIFVNSIAGISGLVIAGTEFSQYTWLMIVLTCVGGFLGGFVGSKKMTNTGLTYMLALVLMLAVAKLFFA